MHFDKQIPKWQQQKYLKIKKEIFHVIKKLISSKHNAKIDWI